MRKGFLILSISSLMLGILTIWLAAQGSPGSHGAAVRDAIRKGKSLPLRDLTVRPGRPDVPRVIPNFTHAVPINRRGGQRSPDPVWQSEPLTSETTIATPLPSFSFDGTNDQDNILELGFAVVPPDTEGEVGPNHYVQMNNLVFEIFDKQGISLYGPAPNNIFWTDVNLGGVCEVTNDGDPIVLYDQLADRWIFSQFGLGQNSPEPGEADGHMCFAVSDGPDPVTSSYYLYDFVVSPSLDGGSFYYAINDYPKLGVWPDAWYLTANQFQCNAFFGGCFFEGAVAVAFEREEMLQGLDAKGVGVLLAPTESETYFSLQPSHWEGSVPPPAGAPNIFIMAFDQETWSLEVGTDSYRLWEFSVDWNNPLGSTFTTLPNISVPAFDANLCNFEPCVSQPPPGELLDTLSQFTMYRAQYRNFGTHETIVVNHTVDADGSDLAGIRWSELRQTPPGSSNWVLHQTGTYAPGDGDHRWMGSAAMDSAGNIALGFNVSSASTFPSLRYVSRSPGDPLGTLPGGEVSCFEGTGAQINSFNRWGDYSTVSVDPVDDCTFWVTGEYYSTTSSFNFQTRICSFALPGCGVCNPSPETCNGIDDDCNGLVDDGIAPVPTTCGVGACSGNTGLETCEAGVLVDSCDPLLGSSPEVCDGIDNDCNGLVDEGCPAAACNNNGTCGVDENCISCPNDCISGSTGAVCGNGLCEAGDGENCLTCAADCNGKQNGKPANRFCCGDGGGQNPLPCSDDLCSTNGWMCTNVAATQTNYCCGDALCEAGETSNNCAIDCGPAPFCGDFTCDPGEDSCSCADDCGSPPVSEAGLCTDSFDNDCDTFVDCLDSDCSGDPACTGGCVPTHSKEKGPRCSDGIDNDCDGLIDGADPDC